MNRLTLTVTFLSISIMLFGQTLKKFNYSDCHEDTGNDSTKIQVTQASKELTIITLKTYAPCSGNFVGEIEIKSIGILDLRFKTKPTQYKNKKGEIYELIEVADCNCLFVFTYEISTINDLKQTSITVHGKTALQINQANSFKEIKVEFDSIRR
ncbi:MAG: hypothetical protein KF803_04820 [Cyclobacteriaceae bacterium]|nr:hypothetical protein [Cyclobacteriaceae bacterium]